MGVFLIICAPLDAVVQRRNRMTVLTEIVGRDLVWRPRQEAAKPRPCRCSRAGTSWSSWTAVRHGSTAILARRVNLAADCTFVLVADCGHRRVIVRGCLGCRMERQVGHARGTLIRSARRRKARQPRRPKKVPAEAGPGRPAEKTPPHRGRAVGSLPCPGARPKGRFVHNWRAL